MATGKKYDIRIIQMNELWTAEITRKITSKKTVVSKSQDGFASNEDAKLWAENELKSFMHDQVERNKRQSIKRDRE